MEIVEKIIDFDQYCKTCKHRDLNEVKDPCNDCLDNPTNINSKKPIYYEEDKKKIKEEIKREKKDEF